VDDEAAFRAAADRRWSTLTICGMEKVDHLAG
jgi:hypothetical protein